MTSEIARFPSGRSARYPIRLSSTLVTIRYHPGTSVCVLATPFLHWQQ